jgi:hypothetical protein
VSTKWYVRALIQQQQQFNHTLVRLLNTLVEEQHGQTQSSSQEIQVLLETLLTLQAQAKADRSEILAELSDLGERLAALHDRQASGIQQWKSGVQFVCAQSRRRE